MHREKVRDPLNLEEGSTDLKMIVNELKAWKTEQKTDKS